MKKVMKKLVSLVLLIGMVLTSLYVSTPEMGEVQAAAVTTDTDGNYIKEYTDVKTYRKAETVDGSGEVKYVFTAPTLTVDAGDDYADFVFAGWFTDNTCETPLGKTDVTTETAYAKFVPRDTLSVKFQTANATVTDTEHTVDTNVGAIRFISSVDSLDYSKIGFELEENVQSEEKITGSYEASDVFQRIDSTMQINGVEKEYNFSPKVIGTKSEHLFTAKWPVTEATKSTDFKVQAYWITLDGTKVLGDARVVGLDDGSSSKNILNLSVDNVLTTENDETYTARLTTYATAAGETFEETFPVEVLYQGTDYTNIRINMDSVDLDGVEGADVTLNDLTSATKVTIAEDENATGVYRRYDTSHESTTLSSNGTTYVAKADASWFYIDQDATRFIVASAADLYGFDYVAENITNFSRDTITLVRDVEINKGTAVKAILNDARTAVVSEAKWEPDEGEKIYDWNPIASAGNQFNGTFDGDDNTISGLYQNVETQYNGLFARTTRNSVIKNVSLKNSYLKSTKLYFGSFVGESYSYQHENLYSDAILIAEGSGGYCGGIMGRLTDGGSGASNQVQHYVNTCQFEGQILLRDKACVAGGIVGQTTAVQKITLKNCLNSGEIISSSTDSSQYIGGMIGAVATALNAGDSRCFISCIDIGMINIFGSSGKYIGSFMGYSNTNSNREVENCYTLSRLYCAGVQSDKIYHGGSTANQYFNKITKISLEELCALVENSLTSIYVVKDGEPALKYFAQ